MTIPTANLLEAQSLTKAAKLWGGFAAVVEAYIVAGEERMRWRGRLVVDPSVPNWKANAYVREFCAAGGLERRT